MNSRQNTSAKTRFYRVLMGKYFKAVLYLKSAHQQNCGLPFVDDLLYNKQTNNPKFRIESVMEQEINGEPYIALTKQCMKP